MKETYNRAITLGMKETDYNKMCEEAQRLGISRNEWLRRQLFSGEIETSELVESFETNQCFVSVYKTGKRCLGEEILVLTSIHKNNDKILIRFGNAVQIACIRNTYKIVNQRPEYTFQREQQN